MLTIVSIKYLTYTYFPARSFSKDISKRFEIAVRTIRSLHKFVFLKIITSAES